MDSRRTLKILVSPGFCLIVALMLLFLPLNWVIGWFLAVIVHEFGHLVVMLTLRIRIYSILFDYHGVFIRTEPMKPVQEIFCAAGGPILGASLLLFRRMIPHTALCAFVLTFLNILPLYPLDGGRVLCGILQMLFETRTASLINKFIVFLTRFALCVVMMAIAVKYSSVFPIVILMLFLIFKKDQKNTLQTGYTDSTIEKNLRGNYK